MVGVDINDYLPDPDGIQLAGFFAKNNVLEFDYSIRGTSGDDLLRGRDDDQTFFGYSGHDELYGGNGADKLYGGEDGDSLYGQKGNDELNGGAGRDFINGGAGKDVFQYDATATDSNGLTVDTITDFVSATDKIDTVTTVTYAGEANGYIAVLTSLTKVAYQGVLDTSTSTLYIDVDGNAILDIADIVISLTGVTDLAQADFM